ncbi:hypothetical protein [Rhodoblastus sp.]|uniref:hypothetical protein n=1 Tax=Rhodoblastus sp. TaxID=1962975 RepID=UPI003F9C5443
MDAPEFWARFVVSALAIWRLCHLVAAEDGPANSVAQLRGLLANSIAAGLVDCFGCLSLWVAIPFAFFVSAGPLNLLVTWLALSGAAFLLERMSPEPVVVERIPDSTSRDL